MTFRYRFSPVVLFAALLLAGCSSTKPYYASPEAAERYQSASHSTLFVDMMLAKDIRGDQDLIDIPHNRSLGETLVDSASAQLARKGFTVGSVVPAAVGHLVQPMDLYRVVQMEGEREWDSDSLATARAPFFADSVVAMHIDTGALAQAYIPQRGEAYPGLVNGAMLPDGAAETVVLITARGRSVAAGKQIGQSLATSILTSVLTMGLVSVQMHERSYVRVGLYLVEPENGHVLWADDREVSGFGRVDLEDVTGALADLTAKLPDVRQVDAEQP